MESEIIQLIARDRLEIPLSSMYQKVKRVKKKDAGNLAEKLGSAQFAGERTYAFVESEDKERARGMKEAIAEFAQEFPKYGKIPERRVIAEEHLYFGVNPGCRLTTDDYITALQSTGLSEKVSRELYPDLIKVSRKLAKAREEKRSVIVGKYAQD